MVGTMHCAPTGVALTFEHHGGQATQGANFPASHGPDGECDLATARVYRQPLKVAPLHGQSQVPDVPALQSNVAELETFLASLNSTPAKEQSTRVRAPIQTGNKLWGRRIPSGRAVHKGD